MNVSNKEAPALPTSDKPWIAEAIEGGRQVPNWIAALPTKAEFEAMMNLRERAFPKTKKVSH